MVQLLISDLDGTLLPKGETEVSASVLEMIGGLAARGVAFAVASGRPYYELGRLFAPVLDCVILIGSDGGVTVQAGQVLYRSPIPRGTAETLFGELKQSGRDAYFCGKDRSYLLSGSTRPPGGAELVPVTAPEQLAEECYKIVVCGRPLLTHPPGLRLVYQDSRYQEWTALRTDKGAAAAALQARMGLSAKDCAVFGDGENDLGMLRRASARFVMRHAGARVKQLGTQTIDRVETAVAQILRGR